MLLGGDGADYQAQLDFAVYKAEGRDFFILKGAGGSTFRNQQATAMATRARDAGVALGFYQFMGEPGHADWVPEAEAENLEGAIKGLWTGSGPICLDAEVPFPSWYSGPPMTEWIQRFHLRCRQLFGITKLVLYTGTYFIDENGIDASQLSDVELWLASWQAELPAKSYWRGFPRPLLWQNASNQRVANLEPVDTDTFYGTIEEFRILGGAAVPENPWAYLQVPFGPRGHVVHPYFHGEYSLEKYGYPEGPAAGYTDNSRIVRQLFENGCFEADGRAQPRRAALGQAYFAKVGGIVDWPDTHPLLP